MLLTMALSAAVGGGECDLSGSWGYLSPFAFNHTTNDRGDVNGWHNQDCKYDKGHNDRSSFPKPERADEDLDSPAVSTVVGTVWETLEVAVKPYPSCRYTHAALDGVAALQRRHGFDAAEVTDVQIGLPKAGMILVGDPIEHRQSPATVVDGQFSLPFVISVMLRQGSFGWDDFERHLGDCTTLELCRKITPFPDPRVEPPATENFAATVSISTLSGNVYEQIVPVPSGEPQLFPSNEEIEAKVKGLVLPTLGQHGSQILLRSTMALETITDVAKEWIPATIPVGK